MRPIQRLLIIILVTVISACGNTTSQREPKTAVPNSPTSDCQVIRHELGETRICGTPHSAIALDPHVLDLMLSLGIQPVGYAEVSEHLLGSPKLGEPMAQIKYLGDRVTSNPTHIGTRESPSLEAIVRLKPELILKEWPDAPLYANLTKIAPTLIVRNSADDYQWQQGLLTLAQVFNREQQAKQVIDEYEQSIAQAKAELDLVANNSNVLLLAMGGVDKIAIDTEETFVKTLLKELGFQLTTPKQLQEREGRIDISLEIVPQLDADMLFVSADWDSTVKDIQNLWREHPILRSHPAARARRVYVIDGQLSRIRGPIASELMLAEIRKLLLPLGSSNQLTPENSDPVSQVNPN